MEKWYSFHVVKFSLNFQCEDGATSAKIGDPLEVNKLSESIARAACIALTKLLDLLAASGLTVLAVRATMDQGNVMLLQKIFKISGPGRILSHNCFLHFLRSDTKQEATGKNSHPST